MIKRISWLLALLLSVSPTGCTVYAVTQDIKEGGPSAAVQTWERRHALFAAVTQNGRKGFIRRSVDGGVTWKTVWDAGLHARTRENRITDIAYGNGRLVAVGNTIVVSDDRGATWKEIVLKNYDQEQMFVSNKPLTAVTFGGGFFVTVGPNHVLYSSDGFSWKYVRFEKLSAAEQRRKKAKKKGEYPPDLTQNLMFPLDIVYAGGLFFVSGGSRDGVIATYSVVEETLVLYRKRELVKEYGKSARLRSGGMQSIAYNGRTGLLAASGGNRYMVSNDLGATWIFASFPGQDTGTAVLFSKEKWLAATTGGKVYFTHDIGSGWHKPNLTGSRNRINDICYANGFFFIVTDNDTVIRSPDEKHWALAFRGAKGFHIMGITYADLGRLASQ